MWKDRSSTSPVFKGSERLQEEHMGSIWPLAAIICEESRSELCKFRTAMAFRGVLSVALLVCAVTACYGRNLASFQDGGIAMVTDLNAGRFSAVLGHSKEVLHFANYAAKYVFTFI